MPKPSLVILGSGFAALSILKDINLRAYDVTVVSPRNHFLFTPLLPSTTVGTIEFRSIIEPVRSARQGVRYYQAACMGIDPVPRVIHCVRPADGESFPLTYDILVVTVGSVSNTYGIPGVERHALFLRDLADARAIRQKIIDCFERASLPGVQEDKRKRLLHFVVVGGGPTGIEFAAEMHDFCEEGLRRYYPLIMGDVHITLLEAANQILTTFDAALGAYTMKQFRRQRITVKTGSIVTEVQPDRVILGDGSAVPYGLLVWSTGIGPSPLVNALPFPKDKNSRILVDEFLRVQGFENIYAAGDCATPEQKNLPATGQVAQQEGFCIAGGLNRLASGKAPRPFRYRHLGMLAYIGSNRALADLSTIKSHGFATWLFWRSAYLTRLVSLKNKILVVFDWLKTLVFGRDISRF